MGVLRDPLEGPPPLPPPYAHVCKRNQRWQRKKGILGLRSNKLTEHFQSLHRPQFIWSGRRDGFCFLLIFETHHPTKCLRPRPAPEHASILLNWGLEQINVEVPFTDFNAVLVLKTAHHTKCRQLKTDEILSGQYWIRAVCSPLG